MGHIDINSDIAESYGVWTLGVDNSLYELISSANIACGFHGGDPLVISQACEQVVNCGIAIGAQVSYPDLRGFGRRFIDVPYADLVADIIYQIGALQGLAQSQGGKVAYVKPHGALYSAAVHHQGHARAIVEAILAYNPQLSLVGLPDALCVRYGNDAGLTTCREAFIDRQYCEDGTLVPRDVAGAVIVDPQQIVAQTLRIIQDQEVVTMTGAKIPLQADSLCIHSDTPAAAAAVPLLLEVLEQADIQIRSCHRI